MILGLDIAIRHTGVVLLDDKGTMIMSKTISSKAGDSTREVVDKYMKEITAILDEHKPNIVAIEGYAFGAIWNLKSITQNAELTGLIKWWILKRSIRLAIVGPMQLKKFVCGKGNEKKAFIPMHVKTRYNIELDTPDEVDAYVLAQIGLAITTDKSKDTTDFQKETLKKIKEEV